MEKRERQTGEKGKERGREKAIKRKTKKVRKVTVIGIDKEVSGKTKKEVEKRRKIIKDIEQVNKKKNR